MSTSLLPIVMAKLPETGRAKTRLVSAGGLTAEQAAAIASAMLRCIVTRLAGRGPVLIAVSPDDGIEAMREHVSGQHLGPLRFTGQGSGDLGRRMARVWQKLPQPQGVAFYGIDSPDLPAGLLDDVADAVTGHDVALGPTDDGGIWTLAARQPLPALLADIDWGTEQVYDQLRSRASDQGLSVHTLSRWRDIDRPTDVPAMMRHLEQRSGSELEPALAELLTTLRAISATAGATGSIPEYAGEDDQR